MSEALSLYVRHLAWLHATPKNLKKSRQKDFRDKDEDHPLLKMPDVESEYGAGYVIGLLHEAGLMSSTGMGPVPLSWAEIKNWLEVTESKLGLWERLTIKKLSEDYVGELLQAADYDRPPPYEKIEEEIDREAVQNKIKNFFSGLKTVRR